MNLAGDILYVIGSIIAFVGFLAFLVAGFRKNFWWGIAMIFIPFIPIFIFMIIEFRKSIMPFVTLATGIIISAIGYGIGN